MCDDQLITNMIKCVIIGDGQVGKTSLLVTYESGEFPSEYIPNLFGGYDVTVSIAEETYNLVFWDDCGCGAPYDGLPPVPFPSASVYLVCFSVVEPDSYENIKECWVRDIKHHYPNTPFLLLGTKVDLRVDRATLDKLEKKKEKPVSKEEGEILAKSLKAAKYVECSALTREGVKNVFDQAIFHQLEDNQQQKMSEKKKCNVI